MNGTLPKIFGGFAVFCLIAGCITSPSPIPASAPETAAALESHRDLAQEKPGYCIALRGNGELEPAHWGALAKTVEELGIPKAMAGGSSATISMFFLDSMASNPAIFSQPPEIQKERASLMIKSLHGFFQQLQKSEAWKDVSALYGHYQAMQTMSMLDKILKFIAAGKPKDVQDAIETLNQAIHLGLVDDGTARPLLDALNHFNVLRARFYIEQMQESVQVFGKFNAEGDANLFFRAGVANFEKAARSFGRVAGFYAAAGDDPSRSAAWEVFLKTCGPQSAGLNWPQIISKNPDCGKMFGGLYQAHFQRDTSHIEDRMIGNRIAVFPTTAVLTGSAVTDFREARKKYHESLDKNFGVSFKIQDPEQVHFGYWGDPRALQTIASHLDKNDQKSRRFMPLGMTTWAQVLSLSPAEPGLSPFKDFMTKDYGSLVSAGGWSDLHPVGLLKAAGCEDVVYLTRRGGESLFAQGVAKRLLNLNRDWKWLRPYDAASTKLNDAGDRSDLTSDWSQLYNLANPNSSVNRSLSQASAVLCTNWNEFDVLKNFVPLIEDSYRSPFWINPRIKSALTTPLGPVLHEKRPGCAPY